MEERVDVACTIIRVKRDRVKPDPAVPVNPVGRGTAGTDRARVILSAAVCALHTRAGLLERFLFGSL